MTTEVNKSETKPTNRPPISADLNIAPPALDVNVMSAIQASVQATMKEAVSVIIQQLKPPTIPTTPAPSIPVRNAGAPVNSVPAASTSYVSKLQGIPVEEGQDLRHVSPHVIHEWFNKVETRWKENYNQRKMDGTAVQVGWTRG